MNRYRLPFCGAALIAGSLIAAAPAAAGTLTVDHGKASISYTAAAGESNKVSIAPTGPGVEMIQDRGVDKVPLTEIGGPPCLPLEAWKYKCAISDLGTVSVDLGDGTDTLDLSSAGLPAVVVAGAGQKTIATGSGNDQVFARNGTADSIKCGAGDDTVVADKQDALASDCEHVDFSDRSGSTASSTSLTPASGSTATADHATSVGAVTRGATNVFQTPLGLTLPDNPVTMSRPDRALVHLACAATSAGGCRGDITLELPVNPPAAASAGTVTAARGHYVAQQRARRPGARRIGTRRFRLAPGQKTVLPMRIRFRGHFTAVERRRRRRAVLKIAERDLGGKVVDVQTRVVTLKLSNKSSRVRRVK